MVVLSNIWGVIQIGLCLVGLFGVFTTLRHSWYQYRDKSAWDVKSVVIPNDELEFLNYIKAYEKDISLVVYELGKEREGIFLNPTIPRPLASTKKIIVLAAFAIQVNDGLLHLNEYVPLKEIEKWYLPGTDGRAHNQAVLDLTKKGRVQNKCVTLEDIAWMMIRFSSNAATDYLINRIQHRNVQRLQDQLFKGNHEPITYLLGSMLLWSELLRGSKNAKEARIRLSKYSQEIYLRKCSDLAEAYVSKQSVLTKLSWKIRGFGGSFNAQATLANADFERATALDYANMMSMILSNTFISQEVSTLMKHFLEWPMNEFAENGKIFHSLGTKGGSFPGILTSAYFAETRQQHDHEGRKVVLSLFFSNMPTNLWRTLTRNFLQQRLELKLLSDSSFRKEVRRYFDIE